MQVAHVIMDCHLFITFLNIEYHLLNLFCLNDFAYIEHPSVTFNVQMLHNIYILLLK